jgi:hypothetical protein
MNLKVLYARYRSTLGPLAAVFTLFTIALALAQTPDKQSTPRITIDGAETPDRIPDWIIWREVFKTASLLSDKSGTKGDEFWVQRLNFSREQVHHLTQHAGFHAAMDLEKKAGVKTLKASTKESKETLRVKLQQSQMNKEVQILEIRDALRARIGEDAYLRLESYARLNIAQTIKVGDMVRK